MNLNTKPTTCKKKIPKNEEKKNIHYIHKILKLNLPIYKILIKSIIHIKYLILSIKLLLIQLQLFIYIQTLSINLLSFQSIIHFQTFTPYEEKPPELLTKKNEHSNYLYEEQQLYQNKFSLQIKNLKSIVRRFFTKPINFKLILIVSAHATSLSHLALARTHTKLNRKRIRTSYLKYYHRQGVIRETVRQIILKQATKKQPQTRVELQSRFYPQRLRCLYVAHVHLLGGLRSCNDLCKLNLGHPSRSPYEGQYLFYALKPTLTTKRKVRKNMNRVFRSSTAHDKNATHISIGSGLVDLMYSLLMFLVKITIACALVHTNYLLPSSPRLLRP